MKETEGPVEFVRLASQISASDSLLLFLDYDGTLVAIAPRPELAPPDRELLGLLAALGTRPGTELHLVSGRDRDTLTRWFGHLRIGLHAEHGFWFRHVCGGPWTATFTDSMNWKSRARDIFNQVQLSTPGSFVETKEAGLAWHYRMVEDAEFAALQEEKLSRCLEESFCDDRLEILRGSKLLEIRMKGVNKGLAASRVLVQQKNELTILAIGDDQTDEDLFAVLPEAALTVHVGSGETKARFRLPDHQAVRDLLKILLE